MCMHTHTHDVQKTCEQLMHSQPLMGWKMVDLVGTLLTDEFSLLCVDNVLI